MSGSYLATGFSDLDGTGDRKALVDCLRLIDSLPYYRAVKRRSCELLELAPGLSVLDVGCGLGDDVRRMSRLVAPGGRAVGLDASLGLLSKARPRGAEPCAFVLSDARRMPFADGSFDRCRTERTLQHLPDPAGAVREMARVLKPGGVMLAYDNDWETFSVDSRDPKTAAALRRFWRDSFRSGRVGASLGGHFRDAGLRDVRVVSATSVIRDFGLADRLYNLRETARRAAARGLIEAAAGREWVADLLARSARGRFACSLAAYTAVGRRDGVQLLSST